MKALFTICEEKDCKAPILYLEDQFMIPKYCKKHLQFYAHVYFKKNLKPIKK